MDSMWITSQEAAKKKIMAHGAEQTWGLDRAAGTVSRGQRAGHLHFATNPGRHGKMNCKLTSIKNNDRWHICENTAGGGGGERAGESKHGQMLRIAGSGWKVDRFSLYCLPVGFSVMVKNFHNKHFHSELFGAESRTIWATKEIAVVLDYNL